ncbi:hypothetical protein [Emticicia sp. 17c]|uniref:hypothetical protein n=1 Tax=Emticicia sp. 17c TaxID=3127704 RepID=UPI00301E20B2
MKKNILFIVLIMIGLTSFGQSNVQLTVKWNSTNSQYEVYAKPSFTQSNFNLGASQISIVVPSSVADSKLTVTPIAGGTWSEEGVPVYAPAAQPANDFHPITSAGAGINFTSGVETLLFTFTLPGGTCADGVRLFINNTDPSSSAAGMSGSDFKNSLEAGAGVEYYQSNYNNTGTQCNPCNITAPELSKP